LAQLAWVFVLYITIGMLGSVLLGLAANFLL
jgi:hypothetical protein